MVLWRVYHSERPPPSPSRKTGLAPFLSFRSLARIILASCFANGWLSRSGIAIVLMDRGGILGKSLRDLFEALVSIEISVGGAAAGIIKERPKACSEINISHAKRRWRAHGLAHSKNHGMRRLDTKLGTAFRTEHPALRVASSSARSRRSPCLRACEPRNACR